MALPSSPNVTSAVAAQFMMPDVLVSMAASIKLDIIWYPMQLKRDFADKVIEPSPFNSRKILFGRMFTPKRDVGRKIRGFAVYSCTKASDISLKLG